ncbi:MAG: sulfotransferase family 2 domain-containing protein, partial [Nitrosopumilaceae archaeon]|nr:sulfotransferase family 2 domain-containing protein [Nitrosopumilaceae archaeon]
VGRFENLNEDFDHVSRQIGIETKLPHVNKSSHSYYKSYYNTKTRDMIAEGFREDIELFGYDF